MAVAAASLAPLHNLSGGGKWNQTPRHSLPISRPRYLTERSRMEKSARECRDMYTTLPVITNLDASVIQPPMGRRAFDS